MKIATIIGARPQLIKAAMVNRILTDHVSDLLFCPTDLAATPRHWSLVNSH